MLSVIVPVYNAEKYLRRCVESILNQTFSDLELLLINDGSTDNSGAICDEYAEKDSRIQVFHKTNGGVSSTRNMGLVLAQGEWVTFVDADDWIETDTFEKVCKRLQEENADICLYDFNIIYADHRRCLCTPQIECYGESYLNKWLRFELTSLCTMIVRKSIYDTNNLRCPIQNYCEDFYLTTKLIYYAKKVTKLDYRGYNYNRLNENSLVNNINPNVAIEEQAIYKSLLDFFAKENVLERYEKPVVWRLLKCSQSLILDSSKHGEFKSVFPSRYCKYVFDAPRHFVNRKVKVMAWFLCNDMDWMVKSINGLRTFLKR